MRHIVLTTLLLGVPLAAGAQDEQGTTQAQQQGAQQQQTQEGAQQQGQPTQSEQTQQDSQQTQSGQGATQDDRAFGRESRTVSAGQDDMSATGGEAEAARAQFTSNVENREPVDEASDISVSEEPVYFFTEIKNGAGQTITHRWLHNGEVMAEVPLQIGSDSWRTWSSKEMMPGWDGEWTVEVVDATGNVIAEESINVDTSGVQTQSVEFSPDDQGASSQQTSGEGEVEDDQQQSSGMEDEEDWRGDALPEEIDYETTDEATDSSMEDDTVDEDGSGDNPKQDDRY